MNHPALYAAGEALSFLRLFFPSRVRLSGDLSFLARKERSPLKVLFKLFQPQPSPQFFEIESNQPGECDVVENKARECEKIGQSQHPEAGFHG